MEYIRSKDIFLVMRDILKLIHPRPMEHGSRVAYMVYLMLKEQGRFEEFELADIVMLATMHDIGAYMTEEGKINDILRYESRECMAHSIYGYLFFKYLSPVPDLAKVLMYHHTDYEQLKSVDYEYKNIAALINIAEKMDIYSNSMGSQFDIYMFEKMAGTKLSADGLALFYQIEAKYSVFDKIKSGEYKQELDNICEYMIYNNEDKKKFLEMMMYCLGFRSKVMVVDNVTTVCVCEELADEMMLSGTEKEILYYGALIHDIGMLAIPKEIIEAPRKLEPEEVQFLRTHVQISERVLKGKIKDEVFDIASAHHERGDGSGYPHRLQDKQMNMPQKILQVADVVTALVNPRSYRKDLPQEKVIAILTEDASKRKLKQQVVNTMVNSYDRILERVKGEAAEIMKMYDVLNMQYELISKKFKI